jgi:phosphate starvation-inducible PhoH-like protein
MTTTPETLGLPNAKKRGRKSKKQQEQEILKEFYSEQEPEPTIHTKKSAWCQWEHLSPKERANFDLMFTNPKNRHQEAYLAALRDPTKKIVVCTGPAGTGKTLLATENGIRAFLKGDVERLVFTRPSVAVDEDLGFLPGSLEEKMAPWIRPIYDVLYQFVSPQEVTEFMEQKLIEIAPLGFMRGRTFKHTWIVADEMQNSTVSQMKMLLTRLGENSRLIITGDLEQFDQAGINGLDDFLSKFKGRRSDSISSFEFDNTDIQREDVVREVLEIYAMSEIPGGIETTKKI